MIPNLKPSNPPMTRGQRRVWLALEEQKRRRRRGAPTITPSFSISLAGTTLNIVQFGPDAFFAIGIQYSADGETNWAITGDAPFGTTSFSLIGADAGFYRVCWEDES